MSTEKSTKDSFELNYEILLVMVEERFNSKITMKDVYEVINRSYGIRNDTIVNMVEYVNELARMAKEYKEENNILYTFFDITLGIITKKFVKDKDAHEILDEMILNRMCELTGNDKNDFEHKNEN